VEQSNEWDNLVLPPGHREMVQAMVETHTQDLQSNRHSRPGMDLVKGKGKSCIGTFIKLTEDADCRSGRGCIILLHGVPGVGKTSTAGKPFQVIRTKLMINEKIVECVAAHTNKPLYPITCGDVGYKAEDVERNMENHFKLAHRWGCVLLLDEADVFLARRDVRLFCHALIQSIIKPDKKQQKDVQRNGLVSGTSTVQ
jgi:SpoVK/Ycf46/Vps4 family AAA+-type ATPase